MRETASQGVLCLPSGAGVRWPGAVCTPRRSSVGDIARSRTQKWLLI